MADIIYKLSYFEKQSLTRKRFVKFNKRLIKLQPYFIKKQALAKVLSCQFYEILKNTFVGCFCILKMFVPVTEFTSAVD